MRQFIKPYHTFIGCIPALRGDFFCHIRKLLIYIYRTKLLANETQSII